MIPSAGIGIGVSVAAGMLAIPRARQSGSAIKPTVRPAKISDKNEYDPRMEPNNSRVFGRKTGRLFEDFIAGNSPIQKQPDRTQTLPQIDNAAAGECSLLYTRIC